MVRYWSTFRVGWISNLHVLFRSWDKDMIGFSGTTRGFDPLFLGLILSFLIKILIDSIVKCMTELAFNHPYRLEDLFSQISPFFFNRECLSLKMGDKETFKEMSPP